MSVVYLEDISKRNKSFLPYLACPQCQSPLDSALERTDLHCSHCSRCRSAFNSVDGILDFIKKDDLLENSQRVQEDNQFFLNEKHEGRRYQAYALPEYSRVLDLAGLRPAEGASCQLLSIGCGSGIFEEELMNRGYKVFGVDISLDLLKHCQFPVVRADMLDLPIIDETYDIVFCAMALHHLPAVSHRMAIQEMHRVLKNGGRLYLLEPNLSFRAKCLHLLSQIMRWRAWHECPIDKNKMNLLMREVFRGFEVRDLASIDWIGLGPLGAYVYHWIKRLFNLIPGTDRNEFFIIEAHKAKLS